MYSALRFVHISLAILTIAGFVLRGLWMFSRSPQLERRLVRIVPHVIDTAFLISGIWLMVILRLSVPQQGWLTAKFAGLVLYIVLGVIALRRGRTMAIRATAFVAALLTYAYIIGVALHKSPASWLALVGG